MDDDKNFLPLDEFGLVAVSPTEETAWRYPVQAEGELRRAALPNDVRADLDAVLNYLLRGRTVYPGQTHPPHIEAALRLQAWLEARRHA